MRAVDRTEEFRTAVARYPARKRRRTNERDREAGDTQYKAYIDEAYSILLHIRALDSLLTAIRRPYLSVDAHPPPSRVLGTSCPLDLTNSASWASLRYLSNHDRDSIDAHARRVLATCAQRVRMLESLSAKEAKESGSGATGSFLRLLRGSDLGGGVRAAHHASITWYLSRRLAETTQQQTELQEERVKRQSERMTSLGTQPFQPTSTASTSTPPPSSTSSWFGSVSGSAQPASANPPADEFDDDSDDELSLTASQIQQFEFENAAILSAMQSDLAAVQQAEQRLLEIASLQTELVTHLQAQTEITDRLFEDAIATTASVEKGNEQLREARKRARESRLFLLVFLFGASFAILFVHYY